MHEFMRALSANDTFRVCSYDRPGQGWAELESKRKLRNADHAIHLFETMSQLEMLDGKREIILIGHSFGVEFTMVRLLGKKKKQNMKKEKKELLKMPFFFSFVLENVA